MSVELKNNQFLSYLLILISLFILVLFTKDQISNVFNNINQKEALNLELQKVREEQGRLNKIALEVDQVGSEASRFTPDFTNELLDDNTPDKSGIEDNFISYFYSYADTVNEGQGSMSIQSVNMTPEKENELGFLERNINITAQVSSEKVMKDFLDYLVDEDAQYRFFIESFFYANDGREGNFNIQVPLKIFYR